MESDNVREDKARCMLSFATNGLKSSYLFLGEAKVLHCHRNLRLLSFSLVAFVTLRLTPDTEDEALDSVVDSGQLFTIRH